MPTQRQIYDRIDDSFSRRERMREVMFWAKVVAFGLLFAAGALAKWLGWV